MTNGKLTIDQLTTRELGFVSDPQLAFVITDLLHEIDTVFGVSAFRSALYLSISAVEGILKHALELNLPKAQQAPSYPTNNSGNPKRIRDLSLFECIPVCKEISLIPPKLENTYDHLREFRNYMHPELELSSGNKIHIGISELAIGILNTTLLHFDRLRFIEGRIWKVLTGNPRYNLSDRQLSLVKHQAPTSSFLVTEDFINKNFALAFDVKMPEGSILNFVHDFSTEDNFKMIRIDKRKSRDKTKPHDDGYFVCTEKFRPRKADNFQLSPDINKTDHSISIEVSGNNLKFIVDGAELQPVSGTWDYDPTKFIGFLNQRQKVDIENLEVTIQ